MSCHAKDLPITAVGLLAISPDSLIFRLIPADGWTISFRRGVWKAIGIAF
jgi:hypothetical protein